MIEAGYVRTLGNGLLQKAHKYERLALQARRDQTLVTVGYSLASLFVVLGMMDVLSTNLALSYGAYEINGIMRSTQEWFGELWYIPKLALQAMVAAMIVWSPNRATICIMTLMCGWTSSIVTSNFMIAYNLSSLNPIG